MSLCKGLLNQAIQYCHKGTGKGARYFLVTDGSEWEYTIPSKPPIAEMSVVSFDLKGPSAAEACLQALSLWRPSVTSGSVQPGEPPVVGLPDDSPGETGPQPTPVEACRSATGRHKRTRMESPISTLKPVPSSHPPQPSEILFPDNSPNSIRSWAGLAIATVRFT